MSLTWNQSIYDGQIITQAAVTEIINNINIERTRRGIANYNFTQPIIIGGIINKILAQELKEAIVEIKPCTLNNADVFFTNELLEQYKNQLNTFNSAQPREVTSWNRTHTNEYIYGNTYFRWNSFGVKKGIFWYGTGLGNPGPDGWVYTADARYSVGVHMRDYGNWQESAVNREAKIISYVWD